MSSGLVNDDATVGRLVRIRRTVMCMLRDRGYLVVEHELGMNRRDFERKYGESFHREDMQISKSKKNDPNDQKTEHRDLFTTVCSRLEQVAKDIFSHHG